VNSTSCKPPPSGDQRALGFWDARKCQAARRLGLSALLGFLNLWKSIPDASCLYRIGYYAPQLINGLTYSLVLVPIGTAYIFLRFNLAGTPLTHHIAGLLCLFSLITLVPQMTNRHQTSTSYESGTHPPRSTAERLFWGATYINTLVSLVAFVCSLVLFVSAHEQFRVPASTSLIGNGAVDNTPADGDGLKYGPCLWMQATSLAVVLLTPMIRIASRVRGKKGLESLESAALEPQSERKV